MALSKRDRNALVFLAVGAVVILGGNLLIPPAAPGAQKKLLPASEANARREVALRTLKRLSGEQDELEPRIATMISDLPAEELTPRTIRDLQAIAAKSNVHLREIKPLRPRALALGKGARAPLEIRFRAAFQPDVVRFLYFVEDPARKMVVDKINVTSGDARFKTVDVSAQITVFTRSTAGVTGAQGETNDGAERTNKTG